MINTHNTSINMQVTEFHHSDNSPPSKGPFAGTQKRGTAHISSSLKPKKQMSEAKKDLKDATGQIKPATFKHFSSRKQEAVTQNRGEYVGTVYLIIHNTGICITFIGIYTWGKCFTTVLGMVYTNCVTVECNYECLYVDVLHLYRIAASTFFT